jgi:hypothetical protein
VPKVYDTRRTRAVLGLGHRKSIAPFVWRDPGHGRPACSFRRQNPLMQEDQMSRLTTVRAFALLTAVLSAATMACSDGSPTGPVAELGTKGPKPAPLAYCPGTPYDSTTRTIGAGGGTIVSGRGSFIVPAGAVAVPTTITMVQPADSVTSYRFYPDGLQFTKAQPTLQIDYSTCVKGPTDAPQIVYVDNMGRILERLPTTVLPKHLVQALIYHFSRYAIAY